MMESDSMFNVGDLVKLVRDPSSVGIVVADTIGVYQGFTLVKFIAGEDAGMTYQINNIEFIGVDDVINEEKEEEVPVSAPVEEKPVAKATPKKKWSKVEIVAMIKENPAAVERGILCLNKHHKLIPEKSRSYVSYWASYIASGKKLSGRHFYNARRTCFFNAKVLVDAANGAV
jgi:hypothetical protein